MRILGSASDLISTTLDATTGTIIPILNSATHASKALEIAAKDLELDAISGSIIKADERKYNESASRLRLKRKQLALDLDYKAFEKEALSMEDI